MDNVTGSSSTFLAGEGAAGPDYNAILGQLTPEQLQAYLFPYKDKEALLQQQLEQAQSLRKRRDNTATTPGGALGQGLAGAVDGISGAYQESKARDQQNALMQQKQDSAVSFQQALVNALRGGGKGTEDLESMFGSAAAGWGP